MIPQSVELWLALARLETPKQARAVLNKARNAVPTSHEIWIAGGRLLEQEAEAVDKSPADRAKELESVDKLIETGVKELRKHQVLLTREQWLKEAEKCEAEASPRTCEAIVKATVNMEIEEEDRFDTWTGDAESAESRGHIGTARAIIAFALRVFPDRKALWRRAADLEKTHGTKFVNCCQLTVRVLTCDYKGSHWKRFLFVPFTIVLRQRCCGSCGQKRSGWEVTFQVPERCWRRHS